jgi:hypothetical protein
MYGGPDAVSYFFRTVQKANWASFIQLSMTITGGDADFGKQVTVEIPRSPDYLMNAWFRVKFPSVTMVGDTSSNLRLRWTRNLMHNLFNEIQFNIGDSSTTIQRMSPEVLDFWTMHTVPAGKRVAYDNMIGNYNDIINPIRAGNDTMTIPEFTLVLPLPFFFSRDTGIAMPCSNMNYTPLKLWFEIARLEDLLIVDNFALHYSRPVVTGSDLVSGTYRLQQFEAWGEFAVVSGPERKSMGKYVRDMLIDNFQWTGMSSVSGDVTQFQLTFSQSARALFFGMKNVTNPAEGSDYTAAQPFPEDKVAGVDFNPAFAVDPISATTLRYDSVERITNFPSDFFSLVMPYYHSPVVPRETGYHYYPYSIFLTAVDPMCSTNYTKLQNIFLQLSLSTQASAGLLVTPTSSSGGVPIPANAERGQAYKQIYQAFCIAYCHIIIRVMGGTVTFPLS